jgi:hypothetical protein
MVRAREENSQVCTVRRIIVHLRIALILTAGLLSVSGTRAAVSSLVFSARVHPAGAQVLANGSPVMTLRGDEQQRLKQADNAARALSELAEKGVVSPTVDVRKIGASYSLLVEGRELVEISKWLAFACGSMPEALAKTWAENVRRAFQQPYLCVLAEGKVVPLGETRRIPVRGNLKQGLEAAGAPAIIEARTELAPPCVVLVGVGLGEGQVAIRTGSAQLLIAVKVMKYAARIRGAALATVTGLAAPPQILSKAAVQAARLAAETEPGASLELGPPELGKRSLALGQDTGCFVPVKAAGSGYLPTFRRIWVMIRNSPVAVRPASALVVSNDPEKLAAMGTWSLTTLYGESPVRLLYHHVNGTGRRALLLVELINVSAQDARVQIVEGLGGPASDEIFVGHQAARMFLARENGDVGYVAVIPPSTRYAAAAAVMAPGQVMSGVAEYRLLDPGPVRLRVRLAPIEANYSLQPCTIEDAVLPDRRFAVPDPLRVVKASYRVGGHWAFVSMGKPAQVLSSRNTDIYGVIYQLQFEIENPTDEAARVRVDIEASSGLARAVVLVDGEQVELPLLRANDEATVARFLLQPGAKRTVQLRTMPQSGSHYPVRVIVRPW